MRVFVKWLKVYQNNPNLVHDLTSRKFKICEYYGFISSPLSYQELGKKFCENFCRASSALEHLKNFKPT